MIDQKKKDDILAFLKRENMSEKIRLANTINEKELREDVMKSIFLEYHLKNNEGVE